jgi:hypothetical protein
MGYLSEEEAKSVSNIACCFFNISISRNPFSPPLLSLQTLLLAFCVIRASGTAAHQARLPLACRARVLFCMAFCQRLPPAPRQGMGGSGGRLLFKAAQRDHDGGEGGGSGLYVLKPYKKQGRKLGHPRAFFPTFPMSYRMILMRPSC